MMKLIDEDKIIAVINMAKEDLKRKPELEGLIEFIEFMEIVRQHLKPVDDLVIEAYNAGGDYYDLPEKDRLSLNEFLKSKNIIQ